jgi:hypothetical protein
MRTDRAKRGIKDLFIQYEIVADEIKKYVENCVSASACCIPKGTARQYPLKGRIKEIDQVK